ncbi:MAG: flavin monoamine oxidase family protein [Solirubrobacteraceae bacterium]
MASARGMYARHAEAARSGIPVDELPAERGGERASGQTRRELIAGSVALAGGAMLAPSPALSLARALSRPSNPRIAIVGAGLAGLRCAHELWRKPGAPIGATIYDANPTRAGGRCWTLRGFFAGGLEAEHGGQLINTNQLPIRRLAARLGLQEEIVDGGDLPSGEEVYWIGGSRYTYAEADADWAAVGYRVFHHAMHELKTQAGEQRLDAMSVPQWLDSTEIGTGSRFGRLMLANVVTENGGDPEDMSALDLIELTGSNRRSSLSPIPGDDERFHIVGGNDQIVSRMIAELPPGAVQSGHELVALRANSDASITLVFDVQGVTQEVRADLVVLALPFSTLRLVDLSRSGLSQTKRTVIDTFGMGSNAKIHVELSHKTWPALGYSGACYGEWDRFCCAWDDSVPAGPNATPALFVGFPGGHVGRSTLTGEAHAGAPAADVQWLLAQIELLYPGTQAAYAGRAYEDHWALDPWVRGAYSYCRVGQASSYGALAAASEGAIHFAGEHTSVADQGFLDGAVQSGERAAREIVRRLGG